jgi:hypothetical protein
MRMRNKIRLQQRALALIERLRHSLTDPGFGSRPRRRPADFTRQCVLTFPVLMLLLLQKSLKSLQAHLQEFLAQLGGGERAATQWRRTDSRPSQTVRQRLCRTP